MKIPNKIVFLDIDGCITSVVDGSSWVLMDPPNYRISESRFELLKRLLKDTGAKVVISSNWRRIPDDGYIRSKTGAVFTNQLPSLRNALGADYFGTLPCDAYINKSEALLLWGEENNVDFDKLKFVVVEDDDREGFGESPIFRDHYIHCDFHTGITEEQCCMAKEILNGIHHDEKKR